MAVSAKFVADFSSFDAAVKRAEIELRSFEAGANKVGPALNRMVDQFSGRKLIQEAAMMTRVLGDAGSIARLTGRELQVAGAKAAEAAEKMRKMGIDVPPGLQRIADAAKSGESAFGSFGKQILATAAGFVTAQAIIGAVTGVVRALTSELKTLTLHGAAVADVGQNFDRLAANAGHLGDVLLGTLRDGTHSTITDFELMKTVNQDLAAGMNLTDQQFGTLARGAFALAQATGGDVKTALDTMNDAMLTGRTRSLAMLTGKIDLTAAEAKFAASIGTTSAHLSEEGKLEAARLGILDAVAAATGRLGDQMDGLDERVAQAQVAWANFENELGRAIATSATLETGMVELKEALIKTFGGSQEDLIKAIVEQINLAAVALVGLAQTGVQTAGFLVKEFYAVQKVFGNLAQIIDGNALAFKLLAKVAAAATFDTKGLQRIDAELAMIETRMFERGKSLKAADAAQAGVDASTGRYVKTLAELQAKMEATRTASVAFVGPLRTLATGHDVAGVAAGRHGAMVKQLPAELEKVKAELAKMHVEILKIENVLPGVTGQFGRTDDSVMKLGGQIRELVKELSALERHGWTAAGVMREFSDDLEELGEHVSAAKIKAYADEWAFVGPEISGAGKEAQTFGESLNDLSVSLTQLAQVSGDSFGGIVKDLAEIVVAWNLAAQAVEAYQKATTNAGKAVALAGMATSFISATGSGQGKAKGAIGGAVAGAQIGMMLGPYGAAVGAAAGFVVGLARNWGSVSKEEKEARQIVGDMVTDLQAMSSAAQLLETGGQGWAASIVVVRDEYLKAGLSIEEAKAATDALWAASEAGSAESAKSVSDAIRSVMEFNRSVEEAIRSSGYVSRKDLQALADTAEAVYERMLRDGTYSAEQLADAWEASNRATQIALGDTAAIAAAGAEAAGFRTKAQLEKTAQDAEAMYLYIRDSGLFTAGEAEKAWAEVFGSHEDLYGDAADTIEQSRAAFDAANAQLSESALAAAATTADEQAKLLKDQMDTQTEDIRAQVEDVAASLETALGGIRPEAIRVPVIFDIPAFPLGGSSVTMPQTTGRSGGGGTAVIEMDGRVLAEVSVPHLAGAIERYGISRR